MKKLELFEIVQTVKTETRNALQTMYDAMNHGQQKQIVKDQAVQTMFDCYGVEYNR